MSAKMIRKPLAEIPAQVPPEHIESADLTRSPHPLIAWDTPDLRERVVDRVSKWLPLQLLPWISDEEEREIVGQAYDWLVRTIGGLENVDYDTVRSVFVTRVNAAVDIPYVPEWAEASLLRFMFDVTYQAISNEVDEWLAKN